MKAFGILWVGYKCHKNHFLEGVGLDPVAGEGFRSLIIKKKKTHRGGVVPVEAFLQSCKDRLWTGLGHER